MSETITYNGREFRVIGGPAVPPTAPRRKKHRQIPTPLDGAPVAAGTLALTMAPPSVNSLFHNRAKGRGKTLVYRTWRAAADAELRAQPSWHVPGKVAVKIIVGTNRGDVDNRIKATLDALVGAGRIEDDKHVAYVSAERDTSIAGASITIARAG